MFDIPHLLILIPAMPLAAALVTAALGKRVLGRWSHWPTVAAIALSLLGSLLLVFQVRQEAAEMDRQPDRIGYERTITLWNWAAVRSPAAPGWEQERSPAAPGWVGDEHSRGRPCYIDVTLRADPLTAAMLAMVTFISLLVAVYSIGYMHDDPGYWRFFSYIALFVFSMTMLVSVSNFVLLYVFWEAVGFCSYILIGFWYQKPEAAAAGKKAFLVNRVGDFGFALGVFLLWTTYGTLDFHDTAAAEGILGQARLAAGPAGFVGGGTATAICLLLMLGACGKSAQFPLHVWLPDAMEGPSPVSALIHAATMVTAGVYLIARCTPLFAASTDAQYVVAALGCFTALMAAIIALTQTDLKRILAYSTISQLGYMFLGLGAGTLLGITAGMFHLMTHAFFKALLFLAAGSVMHAMGGVIDVRRFGGLRKRLPITHWTFLFGCLALAGIVPFAGFWSKDAILVAVHHQAAHASAHTFYLVLYLAAMATAGLTALYTFRAFFRTFYGRERIPPEAGDHSHESPRVMTGPLVVLAVGALVVGALFEWTHGFADFLGDTPSLAYVASEAAVSGAAKPQAEPAAHLAVAVLGTVVALVGAGLAAVLYIGGGTTAGRLARAMDRVGLYRLSRDKFYCDEIYDALVVRPLRAFARTCYWADQRLVDALVDLCGRIPPALGTAMRPMQNGLVQFYALAMVLGLLVLLVTLWM